MKNKNKKNLPKVNRNVQEKEKILENNEKENINKKSDFSNKIKILWAVVIVQFIVILFLLFKLMTFSMMIPVNNMNFGDNHMNNRNDMDSMMNEEEKDSNDIMKEHCKMMPEMQGCEKYLENNETENMNSISGSMDSMMMGSSNENKVNRSIKNLELAQETQVYNLKNNDKLNLSVDIIKKEIAGKEIRMFGYNGQIPGPLLHVEQGAKILVNVTNNLDMETTVHWHGLRLNNSQDGVPEVTMETQKPGESFEYTLDFVDEGIYWYHPHVREDYQQELGLYGNMLVDSKYDDYYNNVNKEVPLILDDILIENGDVVPFFDGKVTHSLMGRFGNIMLTNGDDDYNLEVNKGDVVRFYITNVANTRTFNFSIPGAQIKLIGGDIGSYEKEEYVNSLIIAPAERYTIEAYFENIGEFNLKNINPENEYNLGSITVKGETKKDYSSEFFSLRENKYVKEDIDNFREYFDKEIDSQITLSIKMQGMNMDGMNGESDGDTIEWEDTMNAMNKVMTNNTMEWVLMDKKTGKENSDIKYKYKVGDKVKIRIFNDPNSMHPMQHPIHFHGQRFLVLEKDGKKSENLVWQDTVLVPVGSYVDILLDVTNPGEWMAHCHIAEHLQSGMMMTFKVEA